MKRIVAIDAAILCNQSIFAHIDICQLLDTIAENKTLKLLFKDEYYNYFGDSSFLLYKLSDQLHGCIDNSNKRHIKTVPNLTDKTFSEETNNEIKVQAYTLHVLPKELFDLLITNRRIGNAGCDSFNTILNKEQKEHPICDISKLQDFIKAKRPVLKQIKHFAEEYQSVHGEVSTFKAYDQWNSTYAESLLQTAYDNAEESEEFPHYIYTWDERNNCYVEFRYDRNKVYHGRDLSKSEYDAKVPSYIRKRFNH